MRNLFSPHFIACAVVLTSFGVSHPSRAQSEEPAAGAPYSPYPSTVLVTKVKHFDNMCWKIAAAGGTFYFETGETGGKTGFSSAFDMVGNDWIGNDADKGYNKSPANGGKHEFRGFPNFGQNNFDHPQRSGGATTRWVDEAGKDVPFADKLEGDHLRLRSSNATYEIEYHFFRTHAAIKVIKASDKYAFLYEGPIGGEQEAAVEKDYYVLSDGKARACKEGGLGYLEPEFGNKFPSPFFYLVDSDAKDTQVWYVGAKDGAPDTAGDEGWRQGTNMVIFSFGRDQDMRAYTGTAAVSVFGFQPKSAGHEGISAFINARLAAPFVDAGGSPGGAGGSGAGGGAGGAGGASSSGGSSAGTGGVTSSVAGAGGSGGTVSSSGASGVAGGSVGSGGVVVGGGPSSSGAGGGTLSANNGSATADSGCSVSPARPGFGTAWAGLLALAQVGWLWRASKRRRRASDR